ncbi:MAG: polysaccharide deacetylase family protein [Acidimicrobiales bacterium]
MALTFTLDLEDHRPSDAAPQRYPMLVRRLLAWLDERAIQATVFVVGEIADEHPDLLADVAAAGHEIGLHGWTHAPLPDLGPERFAADTAAGKERLEAVTGNEVVGYRAPIFSLIPSSGWAPEVLTSLGFAYSSSVLPAPNPQFGWPGAPTQPFRWPSGLVELPAPIGGVGPLQAPALGGAYLRILPWPVVQRARRQQPSTAVPWTYCHPYDFDPDEPYWVVPEVGRPGSRLIWFNRKNMLPRLHKLFAEGSGPPLRDRARSLGGEMSTFRPAVAA